MSIDIALTSDELAALAGPSHPRWFAVIDTTGGDNLVATAQVDMLTGFNYPIASVNTKSRSADWSNIEPNMTILFGSTPGGFDHGIFRVRAITLSNALLMSAIGLNDTGLTNIASGMGIVDDDYITILRSWDPFGAYPRIDYSGVGTDAIIYEDWAKQYDQFNRYPPPRINVFIKGRPENYAAHVYGGTSDTFDIAFEIGLWPTSSSADFEITLPAAFTLNSGSLTGTGTSGTINVTAPHSPDPHVVKILAVEDNGSVSYAYRKIWITSNTYPPLRIVSVNSRVDDRTGSKWTITLNQLVGMRPGAMVHLFDAGKWSGVDVPSAIHAFSGYVARRREITDVGTASVTLDLVGPSYMMQLIGGQSQIFSSVTFPHTWQQLYFGLTSIDFVIWGFMAQRVPGLIQGFNYTPFGFMATQKRMTDWRIDAADLLSQIQALAKRIAGGNFGCDSSGEFMLRRRLSNLSPFDRLSIPKRASLTAHNYKQASLGYEQHPKLRHLRGEAFVSDGVATNTPYWSDAPVIPSQGTSEEKFDKLVVDSAPELYEANGLEYTARNNPYPDGTADIPKNWAVFRPAQMLPVGLDIASRLRYDKQEWQANILPVQVSYTHNPDGTIDTQVQFEQETAGLSGVDSPIPQPDPTTYNTPYQAVPFAPIPAWKAPNPNPAGTSGAHGGAQSIPRDGSVAFCGTATQALVAFNVTGTPKYRDVTPPSMGAFQIQHGMIQIGGSRAWLLASDGTDSKVWTTSNLFATPKPAWTVGASQSGVYTLLRTTDTAGTIAIYSPSASNSQSLVDTWSVDSTNSSVQHGSYATVVSKSYLMQVNGYVQENSTPPLGLVDGYYASTDSWATHTVSPACGLEDGSTYTPDDTSYQSSHVYTMTRAGTGSTFGAKLVDSFYGDNSGSWTINLYEFAGSGDSTVLYSSDNGATFGSAITVGVTPGAVGGFDVQHVGSVSYAAMIAKTRKAATFGGSYSDDQTFTPNPVLIEIPWAIRNSNTTLNTGSSPQYIIGLDAPDGSDHTLFWVVSGSPVNITPVIGGNPGIPVGPNCLCTWLGRYVAFIGSFGGTKHLVVSIDGGSTWLDRGAVNAIYLRLRRLAKTPGQLYTAGATLKYSSTFGAVLASKTMPAANLVFFEPVG